MYLHGMLMININVIRNILYTFIIYYNSLELILCFLNQNYLI